MTIHDLVSPALTPEEALNLCEALDALRDAIWRIHGAAMADHIDNLAMQADFEAELQAEFEAQCHV